MNNDPIVEEIHRARQEILRACNGDLDLLMSKYKEAEDQHRNRVVTYEELQRKQLKKSKRHLTPR